MKTNEYSCRNVWLYNFKLWLVSCSYEVKIDVFVCCYISQARKKKVSLLKFTGLQTTDLQGVWQSLHTILFI